VISDRAIGDHGAGFRITGGPLAAKGKVIEGVDGRAPGGNYVQALDVETGQDVWRCYTIARPDEPGGNSWNGLPLEKAPRRVGLDGGQLRSRSEPGVLRRRPRLRHGPPAQSGQTLPTAAPISYSANGRQFIALTVGNGSPHPMTWRRSSRKCRTRRTAAPPCACLSCPIAQPNH
jgi:hypothetical protein